MTNVEDIKQNTRDIHALTNTVTRIATIVEANQKDYANTMVTLRELSEKVGTTISMKDTQSGLREDVRVIRHDLNDVKLGMNAIALVKEKLEEHKVDTLEKITDLKTAVALLSAQVKAVTERNIRIDGGVRIVEKLSGWVWALLSGLIVAVLSNWSTIQSILSRSSGVIGGE